MTDTTADHLYGSMTAVIVAPGQGRELPTGSTRPTVKVGPHNGSRLIGMLESELPPGAGVPGHVHDDYEEVFYVLAGEIQYWIDNDWASAPAGSTVFVPPGRVHAFRNAGYEPARHLAIASPADAMTLVEEAQQAAPPGRPAVFARYRSRLVD